MIDVLIRGGLIVDGSGAPPFRADVGIEGERIAALGPALPAGAALTVEASGLVVAPGFIDMHSHSDLRRLVAGDCPDKISQGITTELLGQDGSSVAPVRPADVPDRRRYLSALLGSHDVDWSWPTFADYLAALESSPAAPNATALVTHGAIRCWVMGMDARPATPDEVDRMCDLVVEAIDAGAFGLSTGLIYAPCCYAAKEELLALYRTCAARGGILVAHVRNESDFVLDSIQEMIDIGRDTGVPVHVSHLKAMGARNWQHMQPLLEALSSAWVAGLDVSYDHYPYVAGSTMLAAVLPPWAHQGGPDALLRRLRQPLERRRMASDIRSSGSGWENLAGACGWENIRFAGLASPAAAGLDGKSIQQAADEWHQDPIDVVAEVLLAEDLNASILLMHGAEQVLEAALAFPLHMVGTDGFWSGRPNPRLFGTFPRILGRYVREQRLLDLPEAVRRMTGAPAARLGLTDRGLVRQGLAADLTLFDPRTVQDRSTYASPFELAAGIEWVFVNGRPALARGRQDAAVLAGRVIRRT